MLTKAQTKFTVFSSFMFLNAFAYNALYLVATSHFLSSVGSEQLPRCLIMSGIIMFTISGITHLYSRRLVLQNYLRFLVGYWLFTVIFLTALISFVKDDTLFSSILFIFAFSNLSVLRIVSWNLVGLLYTPFLVKQNINYFSCFVELGIIASSLICSLVYRQYAVSEPWVWLLFLIGLTIVLIFFGFKLRFLRGAYYSSKRQATPVKSSDGSWTKILVSSGVVFFFAIFTRGLFYYIFATYLTWTFMNEETIGTALGMFTAACSVSVVICNFVVVPWVRRSSSLYRCLAFFSSWLAFMAGVCFFYPHYAVIFLCEYVRRLGAAVAFYPYYHYAVSTFAEQRARKIRVFLQGNVRQVAFIVANVFLLFFSQADTVRILILLAFMSAVLVCVNGRFFRRVFVSYHMHNLRTTSLEQQVRSVQALGEKGNIRASQALVELLGQTLKVSLRQNVILTLGQIQSEDYLDHLFGQLKYRDQRIQLATLESLSRYKNFKVQAFLFDLLYAQKLKSFQAKISLIRIVGKMFGWRIIPILMAGLSDEDNRIIANTIETIGEIRTRKMIPLLAPYLSHSNNRVKAQAVIALYPYYMLRRKCKQILHTMFISGKKTEMASALYAVGRLRLKRWIPDIVPLLSNEDLNLRRQAAFCLVRLNYAPAHKVAIKLLLDIQTSSQCLQQFATLPPRPRVRLIELIQVRPCKIIEEFVHLLEASRFDFTEELPDLYYSLK